ncbi:MAG TPA: hypothetical protein VGJ22_10260 [Anaerolineales bacterium]
MNRLWMILIVSALVAACSPASPDGPTTSQTPGAGLPPIYAPRPGDANLERAEVFLDSTEVVAMESYPVQFAVVLKGHLPTPCHQLRVVYHEPDSQNRLKLEVYSVVDPTAACMQVLQPFDQNVYLGTFATGDYTVWVNEQQVAEFEA